MINPPSAGGDPNIQKWVRWVNEQMRAKDKQIEMLSAYVDQQKKNITRTATVETGITGDAGTAMGVNWAKMPSGQGPDLEVDATTSLLRVHISARQLGVRVDTTTAQITLACMTVSLDGVLAEEADYPAAASVGLTATLAANANAPGGNPRFAHGTFIDLIVKPGRHTIKSEYLYINGTTGIQPQWAYRTISATSI